VATLAAGAARTRTAQVGPFYEEVKLFSYHEGFLKGVRLPPHAVAVLDAQVRMDPLACGAESVTLFGPRIEFLYAQWLLPSPKGLPLWWHPGSSYFVGRDLDEISQTIRGWERVRFITLRKDLTRMPQFVREAFEDAEPVETVGLLQVRCLSF